MSDWHVCLLIAWTKPKCLVLCYACQWFFVHLSDPAGARGQLGLESIIDLDTPSSMNPRRPSKKPGKYPCSQKMEFTTKSFNPGWSLLFEFLRWSLMIFIGKSFWTIVLIFIVISTTFRPICPLAFFRCLSNSGSYTELQTTSFIESTGVTCSDSICHNWVQVFSNPVLLLMIISLEA